MSEISTEEFTHETLKSDTFCVKISLGEVYVLKILHDGIYLVLIQLYIILENLRVFLTSMFIQFSNTFLKFCFSFQILIVILILRIRYDLESKWFAFSLWRIISPFLIPYLTKDKFVQFIESCGRC